MLGTRFRNTGTFSYFLELSSGRAFSAKPSQRSGWRPLDRLAARLGLTELHDLVYVEDGLLDDAGDRSVDPGQARKPGLIEIGRGENAQLALEFQEVIELALVGQLVDELDGDRQLALKTIGRPHAGNLLIGAAPLPGRSLVRVVVHLGGGDLPVLDGSSRLKKFDVA
jgi:hypothetical protein